MTKANIILLQPSIFFTIFDSNFQYMIFLLGPKNLYFDYCIVILVFLISLFIVIYLIWNDGDICFYTVGSVPHHSD